jgi:hypothetical protein
LRYFQFGALYVLLAGIFVVAAALVPGWFLFLLGSGYVGLDQELLLVVASSGLALLGGYGVSVNHARSWNRWQPVAVASLVLFQLALVMLLPLGSTYGLLWFGLATSAFGAALQIAITAIGFVRPAWVRWHA